MPARFDAYMVVGGMGAMSVGGRVLATQVRETVQVFDAGDKALTALLDIDGCTSPSPYSDFGLFLRSVEASSDQLSQQMMEAVRSFRCRRYAGALLIRNLPLPTRLSPTPTEPFGLSERKPIGTERLLVTIGRLLGMPFSFVEWEAKLIIHNKFPIRAHAGFQFGSGSVEFLLHTETPFRDFSPDYLGLFCLRGDPDESARTGLCDFRRVVEAQPEASRRIFRSASFAFETDNPIVTIAGRGLTEPRPLIFEQDNVTQYEYVDDLVATSEEAERALAQLRHDIHANRCDVNLVAGDLLVIDNSHMIHGRSAYRPQYDGTDRWLQRLLISSRLDPELLARSDYLIHDRCINGYPAFYHKLLTSLSPAHLAESMG